MLSGNAGSKEIAEGDVLARRRTRSTELLASKITL
jgi:hypothetical protein